MLAGMSEQQVHTAGETREALLKAVRDAAENAVPHELKALAEAYELLMHRHV